MSKGLASATQKVIEKAGTKISSAVDNVTEQTVQYGDKLDQMTRGAKC